LDIVELMDEVYNTAFDIGWHDEDRPFAEIIALGHSEFSESLEDHRNGRGFDEFYYEVDERGNNKPCGIPSEYADIIIRILDDCKERGIDIIRALREKKEYNKTRPHKHGKLY
jgi:hypothetical protein